MALSISRNLSLTNGLDETIKDVTHYTYIFYDEIVGPPVTRPNCGAITTSSVNPVAP